MSILHEKENHSNEFTCIDPLKILNNQLEFVDFDKSYFIVVQFLEVYCFQGQQIMTTPNELVVSKYCSNVEIIKELQDSIKNNLSKITNIFIGRFNSGISYKTLYHSSDYHISFFNPIVRENSARKIQVAWKTYKQRLLYKKVMDELMLIPKGGINGNTLGFSGGKIYKKAKTKFTRLQKTFIGKKSCQLSASIPCYRQVESY